MISHLKGVQPRLHQPPGRPVVHLMTTFPIVPLLPPPPLSPIPTPTLSSLHTRSVDGGIDSVSVFKYSKRLMIEFFCFFSPLFLEAARAKVCQSNRRFPPQCILTCNDTCLAAHAVAVLCLRATPQIWPTPASPLLHGPRVDLGLKKKGFWRS